MAARSLGVLRNTSKTWCQYRKHMSSLAQELAAEEKHAASTLATWKGISLLIALPVCGYLAWKHLIVGEEQHDPGEYIPWAHLRIRHKPFPWGDGDTSLIHNPHVNLSPEKEGEEEGGEPVTSSKYSSWEKWWIANIFEDPELREEARWQHLAEMQKRRADYLRKKAAAIDQNIPLQPMDLFSEIERRAANHRDSGMEN